LGKGIRERGKRARNQGSRESQNRYRKIKKTKKKPKEADLVICKSLNTPLSVLCQKKLRGQLVRGWE